MPRNYPVPQNGPIVPGTPQRDGIIFPSAAYNAATYTSQEYVNPGADGIRLFFNVTAIGAAGTVDAKIQNFDPASQTWMDVPKAAIAQITSNTAVVFTLHPGDSESPSPDNDISTTLGIRWRLSVTVGVNAVTFSVGADYLDI
jgi:hypothetical protein